MQCKLDPHKKKVVQKEVVKLLDVGIIYSIFNSLWVSLVQVGHEQFGMTVVRNSYEELVPTKECIGLRVCIHHRMSNSITRKRLFSLSFFE